mgnify:FL=1
MLFLRGSVHLRKGAWPVYTCYQEHVLICTLLISLIEKQEIQVKRCTLCSGFLHRHFGVENDKVIKQVIFMLKYLSI